MGRGHGADVDVARGDRARGRRDRGRHQAAQPAAPARPHTAGRGGLHRCACRSARRPTSSASSSSCRPTGTATTPTSMAHGERLRGCRDHVRHLARPAASGSTTSRAVGDLEGGTRARGAADHRGGAREEPRQGEGQAARLGHRSEGRRGADRPRARQGPPDRGQEARVLPRRLRRHGRQRRQGARRQAVASWSRGTRSTARASSTRRWCSRRSSPRTSMPDSAARVAARRSASSSSSRAAPTSTSISPRRAPAACATSTSPRARRSSPTSRRSTAWRSHDLARINRISYNTVLEKGQKITSTGRRSGALRPRRGAVEEDAARSPRQADPTAHGREAAHRREAAHGREAALAESRVPRTGRPRTADKPRTASEGGGPVTRPAQVE